jgi:Holliday junction resolvase-like predicted endonuclease
LYEIVIISLVVSAVVGLIVYLLLKGEVRNVCAQLRDVQRYSEVGRLKEEFQSFGQDIVGRIEALKRLSSEEIEQVRRDITGLAEQKSMEIAASYLKESGITRDEFDSLKKIVEKFGGREELSERLELLSQIFSADLRVLTWQLRLFKLVEQGLAPDAEEDLLLSNGIPTGSGRSFLKDLSKLNIITARKVESYWLNPEYLWIMGYVADPDGLKRQLDGFVKKEAEYQKYIRENLSQIEDGLIVISEEYKVPTGKIDIFARDKNGVDVLIELKYPAAASSAIGQLLKYREDCRKKSRTEQVRCLLVAPQIPERLRSSLEENGIEYREITF